MNNAILLLPILLIFNGEKGPVNPDDTVGNLTIFAYGDYVDVPNLNADAGEIGSYTGHVFLQFKNTSGSTLDVGHIPLTNNNSITISCWPDMNGYNHSGIWYNRESFDLNGWQTCSKASLTTTIDYTGLSALSSYLTTTSNNYYNLLSHNCAVASIQMWNGAVGNVASLALSSNIIPLYVRFDIQNKANYSSSFNYSTNTWCGYPNSNNTFVLY